MNGLVKFWVFKTLCLALMRPHDTYWRKNTELQVNAPRNVSSSSSAAASDHQTSSLADNPRFPHNYENRPTWLSKDRKRIRTTTLAMMSISGLGEVKKRSMCPKRFRLVIHMNPHALYVPDLIEKFSTTAVPKQV